MADTSSKIRRIDWYRVPIEPDLLKQLNQRSDLKGLIQAGGHIGLLICTGALAFYAKAHWHWTALIAVVYLHGMIAAFMINGVHELCHGTVFKTKWLNTFFIRLMSFIGWLDYIHFNESHANHHRYTLHPPDDLEVVLPITLKRKDYFKHSFISPTGIYHRIKGSIKMARGKFEGQWSLNLYPEHEPEKRKPVQRWHVFLLVGHGLLTAVSLYFGLWLIPVLVTLSPFYGGWLFYLCNNTQHVGLSDNVPDFRLCCRTMYVNPVVRFLYWQMNYHTEHHMYAAVPCYNLHRLHQAIKHEMPPTKGVIGAWLEIAEILRKQKEDPSYRYVPPLPEHAPAKLPECEQEPEMVTA